MFQALGAGRREDVKRIILTASGGPFRTWTRDADRRGDARAGAASIPTGRWGRRSRSTSATLMNKGLEVIEAHHLFALPPDEIDVLVHPQSIVHGTGRVPRRLGDRASRRARHAHPDRALPGLAGAHRRPGAAARSCRRSARLTFEKPDLDRFPALAACAGRRCATGGRAPTVLNAANEIAVARIRRRTDRLHRYSGAGRGDDGRCGRARRHARARHRSPTRSPLTIIQDRWRATSCPKSPQRHFR